MIQRFIDKFDRARGSMSEELTALKFGDSDDLVRVLVRHLSAGDDSGPSTESITRIDHGDEYEGSHTYIIGTSKSSRNCTHWAISISYGSCALCDTIEAAFSKVGEQKTQALFRIVLTMLQQMIELPYPIDLSNELSHYKGV